MIPCRISLADATARRMKMLSDLSISKITNKSRIEIQYYRKMFHLTLETLFYLCYIPPQIFSVVLIRILQVFILLMKVASILWSIYTIMMLSN